MALPIGVLMLAGLLLYAGLNNMSVSDALRTALGRPAKDGHLGSLSGVPAVGSATGSASTGSASSVGAAAQQAVSKQKSSGGQAYHYQEIRPMPAGLFSNSPLRIDCSTFATLCYKAAGLPDPNGSNYNGSGFTGTLRSHGRAVSSPGAGDLAIWSNHVVVCLGNGRCVSMGAEGDPTEMPLSAFASMGTPAFRTYSQASPGNKPGSAGNLTNIRHGTFA